ncbi:MAG TPA: hypothetical protein PKJ14_04675 [Candidatus Cloacimonadota bacterium]|nr:hypothetical protein [Candidatus Cloacimonadota bacterium]HQL14736.1 hypothetical protein [Candidatus Cloacimonadota bacterium]
MQKAGFEPRKDLSGGIYAIAGICKNAGKTSFLNYLLEALEGTRLGVLTTGRDGEAKDEVFGNVKPAVRLPENTLFTASVKTLEKLGSAVCIKQKLPYQIATGSLWLLETRRELQTEITGPATALAQVETAKLMQKSGAEYVLIDGSLDRKSIALRPEVEGVFLVAGGSFGNLEQIISELQRLIFLAKMPVCHFWQAGLPENQICYYLSGKWQTTEWTSLLGNADELAELLFQKKPKALYLPSALTDALYTKLKPALKSVNTVVVKHPLNLQIGKTALESLASAHKLYCLYPFMIIALGLNSWSVTGGHLDSEQFRKSVRKLFPDLPVLDIYEP